MFFLFFTRKGGQKGDSINPHNVLINPGDLNCGGEKVPKGRGVIGGGTGLNFEGQ